MLKRTRIFLVLIVLSMIFISIFFIPKNSELNYINQDNTQNLRSSTSQEGAENIIVSYANRRVDLDLYGLVKIRDILTIKNRNNHPINSILVGIPLNHSSNLVYFESRSANEITLLDENTLIIDRLNMVMDEFEMFTIYFNTPLLPYQSKTIIFRQVLKDLSKAYFVNDEHYVNYVGLVFPTVPYIMEGEIKSFFFYPEFGVEGDQDISEDWGLFNPALNARTYEFEQISGTIGDDFASPFLTNLNEYKTVKIWIKHQESNKIEIEEAYREIFISPWGILRIRENVLIKNLGIQSSRSITFTIPIYANGLYISDDLGEILGVTVNKIPDTNTKSVTINLRANRVNLQPNSSFSFKMEYYLPFDNYVSTNWFQESIEMDLFTTTYDYLGKDQTIKIIIDGCWRIDDITDSPESIKKSQGMVSIIYTSDYVTPELYKMIQFTFTIDLFNLLLRPLLFMLLILIISSLFVILAKSRKREKDISVLKREYIPVNEIREFCSLLEEKNALVLEIRQTEEDAKRRKIAKKKYKNLLTKNNEKIEEIQKEIVPFKKIIMETSDVFENTVKKLDVLEAERISVKDSLSLLESRYKRGRLPSRTAYLKLSNDFKKRQKKIDRTIDKLIQQFRSYLL
ncbi:MAG: hypothetical protein ACFFCY_11165 [Promethearchaeota archaeon]